MTGPVRAMERANQDKVEPSEEDSAQGSDDESDAPQDSRLEQKLELHMLAEKANRH